MREAGATMKVPAPRLRARLTATVSSPSARAPISASACVARALTRASLSRTYDGLAVTFTRGPSRQEERRRTMIRRRVIVPVLAFGLTGVVAAQTPPHGKVYRVAHLSISPYTTPGLAPLWTAFQEGMRALGYIEGQNLL